MAKALATVLTVAVLRNMPIKLAQSGNKTAAERGNLCIINRMFMKTLLTLEEVAQFALAVFLFSLQPYAWWVFPALLLLPDLSMVGYLLNPKVGAILYNFVHHKGLAVMVAVVGWYANAPTWVLVGTILFAHSCMDRIFGYGLKFEDSFFNTHLGFIGKK